MTLLGKPHPHRLRTRISAANRCRLSGAEGLEFSKNYSKKRIEQAPSSSALAVNRWASVGLMLCAVVEVERAPEWWTGSIMLDGPRNTKYTVGLPPGGPPSVCLTASSACDIALLHPRIEQWTYVGWYGAARCDRVVLVVHAGYSSLWRYAGMNAMVSMKPCCRGASLRSCAVRAASEVDDLRVLAAELYDGIGFGISFARCGWLRRLLGRSAEHLGQLVMAGEPVTELLRLRSAIRDRAPLRKA